MSMSPDKQEYNLSASHPSTEEQAHESTDETLTVLKKDNAVVPFDGYKIKTAIRKSAERVNVKLTPSQEDFVVSYVRNICPKDEPVQVKTLHNYVELALDAVVPEVARSYREYRNYKTQFVKMLDKVYRKKLELNSSRDASNANADSDLVTTQKSIAYAELNGELYKRFFLTDEENKAQEDGYIYIHDKGARLDTTNCFTRDTRFITSSGIRSFNDFKDGDTVQVLSHRGLWRIGVVHCYGEKEIQRVTLVNEDGTKRHVVECTPNHRWILSDSRITTDLKRGDVLVKSPCDSDGIISQFRGVVWTVEDIEKTDRIEPTWCFEVEVDHSFVLEYGIPSGNCFVRGTRFLTSDGMKSFYDFKEGDTVKVLSHKGVWRNARVLKLPWGKVQRVWFKRGSGKEVFVDCTPDHRWILQDGEVTTSLKVGDRLYPVYDRTQIDFDSLSNDMKRLWCLGFGFADGCISYYHENTKSMTVRLCGRKVVYADNFIKAGYSVKPRKGSSDQTVYMSEVHAKRFPYVMDEERIRVFMNGYMSADGNRQLENGIASQYRGVSVTGDFNDWMYDFLNIAGYYVTRVKDVSCQSTNYGQRGDRAYEYGTFSATGRSLWKVVRIEERRLGSSANLWCLDVEEDHSFMLENGIFSGNCCLFDMKSVLTGGFRMGNINYREPKTVGTAISVMCAVILQAGASQYGGFTVSDVDKLLSPYAEESYRRYYAEYTDISGKVNPTGANIYATKKLQKELEDGFIEVECQLNSATTARGDFVFVSFSFGLAKDRFGQMISSAIMKVRRTGESTSDHIPVLFPKLTFLYDEDMHGAGKEQEWLFKEAVLCTQRAQYPDFLSMTGEGYAPSLYKKYGVSISRMGCVEGNSQVIYRDVFGDIHEGSIEEMWTYLSKGFPVLSQESLGYSSGHYINLHGVSILDKDGFVNCSRIIKNTQNPRWFRVSLSDGKSLVCTADHPWTTWFGDVSHVTQTKDLVPGDVVESFSDLPFYTEDNEIVSGICSVHRVEIASVEMLDMTDVSYDVTTESEHFYCCGVRSHNCRANLSPWYERGGQEPADDNDVPLYTGRLNAGAISLNFPMIVKKAQDENRDFYEVLTYYLDLCRKIHIRTLEYLAHKKAGINPLGFCEGGFYGGHFKENEEIGREFFRPMTVSFGIAALNEATVMYKGKSLYEDKAQFAEEVLRFINDYANKYKKEDGILYALYGTPAESLSSLQVEQFRKKYGIIKGVSDRKYMSNSFHVHVSEDITPMEKMETEYKCFHLCNGGNIIYNRFGADYNTDAYITLIREAMKRGYYYGCNISKNYCCTCGAEFLDEDKCPSCGSEDLVRISRVCGYCALERVHGDTRMNEGKRAEIADRKCM